VILEPSSLPLVVARRVTARSKSPVAARLTSTVVFNKGFLTIVPPRTHRLVVGGGNAACADTFPICVAVCAAAKEFSSKCKNN
jgi:hypothetical protein